MHEQNFEKQVQQKMEGLSLTPSAPVWQKVEGQIRKKKDHRRLIFWLLPLLLAGGGAAWLLSGTGALQAPTVSQRPADTHPGDRPSPASTAGGANSRTTTLEKDKDLAIDKDQATTSTALLKHVAPKPSQAHVPPAAQQPERPAHRPAPQPKHPAAPLAEDQAEKQPLLPAENAPGKPAAENDAIDRKAAVAHKVQKHDIPPVTTQSIDDTAFAPAVDAVVLAPAQPGTLGENKAQPPAPADSGVLAEKPLLKRTATAKWQWAIQAEGGVTSVQSALFQLPSARSLDVFFTPARNSAGGGYVFYSPSPLKDGSAFSAGATVKRALGKRAHLTAGLQYNYYSTRITVGEEIDADTTVSFANGTKKIGRHYLPGMPGTQTNYRNQYHFIQLPVGIDYQLLRNLPLQLHTGAALVRLISTNALLYDYDAHVYYQNNSALNRTQLHLFANLTYRVWKGKAKALNVGPYAQYSISQLQKEDSNKNRLFSAGVRTQLSF